MTLSIPAHQSCEWRELWRVTEWKHDKVYRTKNTGCHITANTKVPHGFVAVSINAKPNTMIEIHKFPHN